MCQARANGTSSSVAEAAMYPNYACWGRCFIAHRIQPLSNLAALNLYVAVPDLMNLK
jgi:hypothetical protein